MNDNLNGARSPDLWSSGDAYERYVGRWSRPVAREFLTWLAVPVGSRWLDVGCGSGALSETILRIATPSQVKGIDRSEAFIAHAREFLKDDRAHFEVGDAQSLPEETAGFDVAVSSLMLNFIPKPDLALGEMTRVVRSGGIVAAYVWDYAGEMQLMRHFWNAAAALDPAASALDEGRRTALCEPKPLNDLFQKTGLKNVEVRAIDIPTDFADFDDLWLPFLGGQGPASSYLMSLSEGAQLALRERLRAGLPFAPDGSIPLMARAWAVRGVR